MSNYKRIIKLLMASVCFLFDRVWEAVGIVERQRLVILYYHSVPDRLVQRFARQLDISRKWAVPISLDEIFDHIEGKRFVSMTFDDGFTSVLENAAPEMEKKGFHFTIFIPCGYIGQRAEWIDNKHPDAGLKVVSKEQLRSLSEKETATIGSHGISHRNLALLNKEESALEITGSRAILQELLGKEVNYLSFPHGGYKESDLDAAKNNGFKMVFGINPYRETIRQPRFLMGRVRVDPSDWELEFWLKIMGCYRWNVFFSRVKQSFTAPKGADGSPD